MKRILLVATGSLAGVLGAAGLIFAAPASAQPVVTFDCAPCIGDINGDGKNDPVWNELTSFGPWEPFFDATDLEAGDEQGLWEDLFDRTDGVPNDGAGAWEKAFPAG